MEESSTKIIKNLNIEEAIRYIKEYDIEEISFNYCPDIDAKKIFKKIPLCISKLIASKEIYYNIITLRLKDYNEQNMRNIYNFFKDLYE